jgi:hypothetical protein
MEHNFNPNKGDYKYILEEERRKENGEAQQASPLCKQKTGRRLWNWIITRLQIRSKKTNKLRMSFPFLVELFS